MKKLITILAVLFSLLVKGQTYDPTTGTVTNKPLGLNAAAATDSRSYFYSTSTFSWRPYQSRAEILSYLNLAKYRTGQFDIIMDSASQRWVLYFRNGTTDADLVYKIPISGGSGTVNTGNQYQLGYYAANGTAISPLTLITGSRAVVTDANGLPVAATTTATEIGYVNGVTSSIQTQLNGKQATGNYITATTGDVVATGPGSVAATIQANAVTTTKINNSAVTLGKIANGTANSLLGYNGSGVPSVITAGTNITIVGGVISASGSGGSTNLDTSRNSTSATITSSTGTSALLKLVDIGSTKAGLMSPTDKGRLDSLYLGLLIDSLEFVHAGDSGINTFFVRNDSTFFKRINVTGNGTIVTNPDSSLTINIVGGGIQSLGAQTGATQTFGSGSSGTAPAISSSGNVHTLNVPLASGIGVTRGAISKTDYDIFAAKISSFAPITTGRMMKWAADSPPQGTDSRLTDMGTGDITMDNGTIVNYNGIRVGPNVFSIAASNGALTSSGARGIMWLADGNATTNAKIWDFIPGGNNFFMRMPLDDYSASGDTILKFNRTGSTFNYLSLYKGKMLIGTDVDNSTGALLQVSGKISASADSTATATGGFLYKDFATGLFKITAGGLTSAQVAAQIHDSLNTNNFYFDNPNLGDTLFVPRNDTTGLIKSLLGNTGVTFTTTDTTVRINVNTLYTGDGTLSSNRIVTGSANSLTFTGVNNFRINSTTFGFSKADGTIPYTGLISGPANSLQLAYTPAYASFLKGIAVGIDTNNNVYVGVASIPGLPLYAAGTNSLVANGGFESTAGNFYRVHTITTNTTITLAYYWINVDATSGNVTVTLPAASTAFGGTVGIQYMFKRIDNSGNTVTIAAAGSDVIDGAANFTLTTQWALKGLQCTSTSTWNIN